MMQDYLMTELQEYQRILYDPILGKEGRRYLRQRGITKRTALYWGLGYCPPNYEAKVYLNLGVARYLYTQRKMWGRIVIPVYDQHGKLVTLSGRLTQADGDRPKYDMYSGEGMFSARRVLFGLWQNKHQIQVLNRAIITEGQLDVITAWQRGVQFVTSSFGAHCSEEHLAIISRYAYLIDIIYDNDKAGQRGLEQARRFQQLGDLKIRLQNPLPPNEDLDSWLRVHSGEELLTLLDQDPLVELKRRLDSLRS